MNRAATRPVSARCSEFYARVLTPEAIVVVPGMLLDRQQALAPWEGLPHWSREEILSDYHLRVGQITGDARPAEGRRLAEQRLDDTEAGEGRPSRCSMPGGRRKR